MNLPLSVTLGLLFLLTAFAATFLTFHLEVYRDAHGGPPRGAPPAAVVRLQRVFGWVYVILYVVMMWEMLPRMWHYQVELPPRTVVHVILGLSIGVILLVKLAIEGLFRHLAMWLPVISMLLLTGTVLLSALSVPFALREFGLAKAAVGGGVYSAENRDRVARLLPQADLPPEAPITALSEEKALRAGRDVLAGKCVVCHDLKTILVQPRTPAVWWKTVERMAQKPSFSEPLTDDELYVVTAYLIAISGDLQRSVRERREDEDKKRAAVAEVKAEAKQTAGPSGLPPFDAAAAAATYTRVCAQCHELAEVDAKPPRSAVEVKDLILRMIAENGLEASKEELDLVYLHMVQTFAGGQTG